MKDIVAEFLPGDDNIVGNIPAVGNVRAVGNIPAVGNVHAVGNIPETLTYTLFRNSELCLRRRLD